MRRARPTSPFRAIRPTLRASTTANPAQAAVNTQTEKNFQLDGQYDVGGFLKLIKVGIQRRVTNLNSIYHDGTVTYEGYSTVAGQGNIKTRTWATGTAVDAITSSSTNAAILSQIQSCEICRSWRS
jgi:hypothetical protein